MKKGLLVMLIMTLFLTLGFGQVADAAKRGGGFKSPKQSYTQTPKKSASDDVSKTSSGTKAGTAGTAAATKKSFGSSFMKGMLVGGLAGLMFGSLFSGMGALGQVFGFLINLIAIAALVMIIVAAFKYIRNRKPDTRRPY
ncbi:hypothetical protein [Paenibacillus sp. NEAU-GSW1]|uniref:hypothetical protein n=1 Tax=Paenibacillus sp. NEAU-GSW1 TaxID=2682486 RepID=UPI0012E12C06|nr:hypothetical protein [Paenibacillus sp. NEAU-GSW1]MUT65368.1 hypothetical protein [Paenibacillus sp. NEAU-GSW1]